MVRHTLSSHSARLSSAIGRKRHRIWRKAAAFTLALLSVIGLADPTPSNAQQITWSHLAGTTGTLGTGDGPVAIARFHNPNGIARDAQGNLYVAEGNFAVRKITPGGVVSVLAGKPNYQGLVNGTQDGARFYTLYAIAVDAAGNVYVSDRARIRKITPQGAVSWFVGSQEYLEQGSADGTGSAARFNGIEAMAFDSLGNLFVADYLNSTIRKVTPLGVVSTFAGTAQNHGSEDGIGSAASFYLPCGLTIDSQDNIYVADTGSQTIRKITPAGVVTTIVGQAGQYGTEDGLGSAARLATPHQIAVDSNGNLYVSEDSTCSIRKITPNGQTSRLAGPSSIGGSNHLVGSNISGNVDGLGAEARFFNPRGIVVLPSGDLLVADRGNHTIRQVSPVGQVTTYAGRGPASGYQDGVGSAARFQGAERVAIDANGNTYAIMQHAIRKITSDGTVTTFAGNPGTFGKDDGLGQSARFSFPQGLAADQAGYVYVADTGNYSIRKISSQGEVTTLAGSLNGLPGHADGTGSGARFTGPTALAVDEGGHIWLADGPVIRKITPAGEVSTIAGAVGTPGFADGRFSRARFDSITGIAVDRNGHVYLMDNGNRRVRKLIPESGVIVTLAGPNPAFDGTGVNAGFLEPMGMATDHLGNFYFTEYTLHNVRKITSTGVVTTIGGKSYSSLAYGELNPVGNDPGVGTSSRFYYPSSVAVGPTGQLVVANYGAHSLLKGVPASSGPPILRSPATQNMLGRSFALEFVLPEAAADGTLTVTFTGTTTRVLTLASSQTSAGTHRLKIDPANPMATAGITSVSNGSTISDGTYTVTLAYQNVASGPVVRSIATGVVLDTTAPVFTPQNLTAEADRPEGAFVSFPYMATDLLNGVPLYNSLHLSIDPSVPSDTYFPVGITTVEVDTYDVAGNKASGSFTVTVQDTIAPEASVEPIIEVAARPGLKTPLGDLTSYVSATDLVSTTFQITQSPPVGTLVEKGEHLVTFTVADQAGNTDTVTTTVVVKFADITDPQTYIGTKAGPRMRNAATGDAVPAESGLPEGATFGTFFTPALSDDRVMAARATVLDGTKKLAAIYTEAGTHERKVPAFQGGLALDEDGDPLTDVTFKSFLDPVISANSAVAFAAKLQGPGAKAGADGIWSDLFSPNRGEMRLVLRTGNPVLTINGGKLKSLQSVGIRDTGLLVNLTLASSAKLVTSSSDAVLAFFTGPNTGHVLLREGLPLWTEAGTKIKSFSVLQPALGSPGQGRWQGDDTTLAKVTLSSGEVRIVEMANDASRFTTLLSSTQQASLISNETEWKSFGLPVIGGDTSPVVVSAVAKGGEVTSKNDALLLIWTIDDSWQVLARENGIAPGVDLPDEVFFKSFIEPVVNEAGTVAFLATLQGPGIKAANKTQLFRGTPSNLEVVAALGSLAPDATGEATAAKWTKFLSYALPSSSGVVFTGELGGVPAKNKLGLWAEDSEGTLRELLRTGNPVTDGGPVLTGITLLNALPGSFGATRSYNGTGSVSVLATFADKTQRLLRIDLP